jgi:hypothetical protein
MDNHTFNFDAFALERGLAVPGPNSPLIIYPFKKAIGGVDGVL